ncbi:MAG: PAS domain S-box protein [Bacteroidota bacterium]
MSDFEDRNNILELGIFLLLCRIAIFVAAVFLVVDTFFTHDYQSVILEVSAIVASLILHRQTTREGRITVARFWIVLFFMAIGNAAWFTGGGYIIANFVAFFIITLGVLLVIERQRVKLLVPILVLNLILLACWHFILPTDIFPDYQTVKGVDDLALLIGSYIAGIFMITYVRRGYLYEGDKVYEQSKALERNRLELEASEQKFRLITENSSDVVTQHDAEDKIVYVSPSVSNLLGFSSRDFPADDYTVLLHPDEKQRVIDDLKFDVRNKARRSTYRYRLRHKQGFYLWIESRVNRTYDENGGLIQSIVNSYDITQEKMAEQALGDSEERYKLVAENSNDVVLVYDLNFECRYVSPSVKEVLGYRPDEFMAIKAFSRVHPSDIEQTKAEINEAIERKDTQLKHIYRYRTREDMYVFLEASIRLQYDEEGKLFKIISADRNVSDRIEVQVALKESKDLYQLLAENSGDIVTLYDDEFNCLYTSPAVKDILGFTVDEFHSTTPFSRIHPDDVEPLRNGLNSMFRKGQKRKTIRYRYLSKDGAYVWLEILIRPNYNKQGNLINFVSVARDVTELVKQQDKIAESEEKYRYITENSSDVIAFYNSERRLTYISPSCVDLFGYTYEELLDNEHISLAHPEDKAKVNEQFDAFAARGMINPVFSYRIMTKNKKTVWIEVRGKFSYDEQGKFTGAIMNIHSIQDIVSINDSLIASERKYRLLAENSNDVIAQFGSDLKLKYISPSIEDLTGYTIEEIMSSATDFYAFVYGKDREKIRNKSQIDIEGGIKKSSYIFRVKHKDGHIFWVQSASKRNFDEQGRLIAITINIRSVNDLVIANEKLMQSQADLLQAQSIAKIGNWSIDLVNDTSTWSKVTYEIYGVDQDEEPFNVEDVLIHPEDRELYQINRQKLLTKGKCDCNVRMINSDGVIKFLNYKSITEYDGDKPVRIYGTVQDMTQQKLAEKEIMEKEQFIRNIIDNVPSMIYMRDYEGRFVLLNKAVASLYGLSQEELIGKTHYDLHGTDRENKVIREKDDYVIKNKKLIKYEVDFTKSDGDKRWLSVTKLPFYAVDGSEYVLGIATDITERRANELELKNIQERYELASEAGHTGIADWYPLENKVFFDRKIRNIIGHTDIEIPNDSMDFLKYFYDKDGEKFMNDLVQVIKSGEKIFEGEYRVLHKDGRIIWLLSRGKAWYNDDGKAYRVVGSVTDITDRKKNEEELINAKKGVEQAAKAKEQMFSVMSHEIRTPLNSVIGLSDFLMGHNPRTDQIEVLNVLKGSADHLYELINNILDYNKIKSEQLIIEKKAFNFRRFIKQAFMPFQVQAENKQLACTLYIADDIPENLEGDSARLKQIIDNLLSNAIKFTAEGRVELNIRMVKYQQTEVTLSFGVKDTGIGISKAKMDSIFEPFSQASQDTSRKYGGTGLGLSIVKDLVELLHGDIKLSSRQDRGSTFKVTIPLRIPENERSSPRSAVENGSNESIKGLKILYVEDVFSNQFVTKSYCQLWGFECDVANNGYEGLEKVEEKHYDIILMDIHMPDMDGYETTRRIRKMSHYTDVPIIAFTADISDNSKKKIFDAGMNDYVLKPVDPDHLYNMIVKLVGSKKQENTLVDLSFYKELSDQGLKPWQDIKIMLLNDFISFEENLIKAVENKDLDELRAIMHKIKPIAVNLKFEKLLKLMDQSKQVGQFNSELADFSQEMLRLINHFKQNALT